MSEKRPTLVLTGANGFIGKHIATFFVGKGWNVVAVVRNSPEQHLLHVLYSKHDLAKSESVCLPDNIDVFIHAGYIKQSGGINAFQLNKQSSSQFLNALESKNVKQKIFLSSLSADHNALSVYGKQKAAIEDLFLAENGTVIRAGLVLGNGGLFGAMREYLKFKNKIPLFGSGEQPLQTVYIDDLVQAIDAIITKDLKGKFVIATEKPIPYVEFYRELAATVNVKPRFVKIPYWFAEFGITMSKLLGRKLPVTKDNLLGLKQMKKTESAADLKKLGVKLRDYKESFKSLA
ncbi:MAG: NAD(P)-dependent oxidoreductase [Bacteroidota bacterium]|nr:NAD(P)-dependent oxidoreductase [Bacteroidota bacterium]